MGQVGTISSKMLLQSTATKFNINNSNWRSDAKEWIGQAMEFIGYHIGFDYSDTILKIKNYRCVIPSNMETIFYVKYNSIRIPLGVDKSDYGYVRQCDGTRPNILSDTEVQDLSKEIDRLNALREMDVSQPGVVDSIQDSVDKINKYLGTSYLGAGYSSYYRHYFYNVDNGYIKTSFESGSILVEGRKFPVDEDGNLLIVNTVKYRTAVEWYIIYMLMLQGYSSPVIKDWREAESRWNDFMIQAQNEGKMPDMEQLERFSQRWNTATRQAYAYRNLNNSHAATTW